jgi:hypothetical protein
MDLPSIFTAFSTLFTRFAIDASICWFLYYFYRKRYPLANVLEEEIEERQRLRLRD